MISTCILSCVFILSMKVISIRIHNAKMNLPCSYGETVLDVSTTSPCLSQDGNTSLFEGEIKKSSANVFNSLELWITIP